MKDLGTLILFLILGVAIGGLISASVHSVQDCYLFHAAYSAVQTGR